MKQKHPNKISQKPEKNLPQNISPLEIPDCKTTIWGQPPTCQQPGSTFDAKLCANAEAWGNLAENLVYVW